LNGTVYLLLPLTHEGRGRRFLFHSFAASLSPSLPLPLPKNHDTTHIPLMTYHYDERGRGEKPYGRLYDGYIETAQPPYPCAMTGHG
jgi:hypothetical protein